MCRFPKMGFAKRLFATTSRALALTLIIAGSAGVMLSKGKEYKGLVLNSPIDDKTAVRFLCYSGGDFVQGPLIFRPVAEEDLRLNTALQAEDGWATYVSFEEMSHLMEALAQSKLSWKESKKAKALEPFKLPDEISANAGIEVVSSMGMAKAKFSPTIICEKLRPLDSALKTQRALLEFQHFRWFNGCQVPGFDFIQYQQLRLSENAASPRRTLQK